LEQFYCLHALAVSNYSAFRSERWCSSSHGRWYLHLSQVQANV